MLAQIAIEVEADASVALERLALFFAAPVKAKWVKADYAWALKAQCHFLLGQEAEAKIAGTRALDAAESPERRAELQEWLTPLETPAPVRSRNRQSKGLKHLPWQMLGVAQVNLDPTRFLQQHMALKRDLMPV